jgi:hypothetical protein
MRCDKNDRKRVCRCRGNGQRQTRDRQGKTSRLPKLFKVIDAAIKGSNQP